MNKILTCTTSTHRIPFGYTEVTQEHFYSLLKAAAAIDPMPHPEPNYVVWEAQKGIKKAWGWSTPGWRVAGVPEPPRYAVREDALGKGE